MNKQVATKISKILFLGLALGFFFNTNLFSYPDGYTPDPIENPADEGGAAPITEDGPSTQPPSMVPRPISPDTPSVQIEEPLQGEP